MPGRNSEVGMRNAEKGREISTWEGRRREKTKMRRCEGERGRPECGSGNAEVGMRKSEKGQKVGR